MQLKKFYSKAYNAVWIGSLFMSTPARNKAFVFLCPVQLSARLLRSGGVSPLIIGIAATYIIDMRALFVFFFAERVIILFTSLRLSIAPRFGLSHRYRIYNNNNYMVQVSKYRYLFFWKRGVRPWQDKQFFFTRPHNLFTSRGVRYTRFAFF